MTLRKPGVAPSLPPSDDALSPSPSPMPLVMEETEAAKMKVRKRRKGRASTILAGRLMSEQGKMVLGE